MATALERQRREELEARTAAAERMVEDAALLFDAAMTRVADAHAGDNASLAELTQEALALATLAAACPDLLGAAELDDPDDEDEPDPTDVPLPRPRVFRASDAKPLDDLLP